MEEYTKLNFHLTLLTCYSRINIYSSSILGFFSFKYVQTFLAVCVLVRKKQYVSFPVSFIIVCRFFHTNSYFRHSNSTTAKIIETGKNFTFYYFIFIDNILLNAAFFCFVDTTIFNKKTKRCFCCTII